MKGGRDLVLQISRELLETEGADVEEEPFYSRPLSGGVFGH